MITIQGSVPRTDRDCRKLVIAVSGGPDSMAVLDFLSRTRALSVAMFDHGTGLHSSAEELVRSYITRVEEQGRTIHFYAPGKIQGYKSKDLSWEEYWRNERYNYLHGFDPSVVVTGHTLDDQVETWLWRASHGNPRLIPYRRGNVIRPFMLNTKADLKSWCDTNSVPYITDPSNLDERYMRGILRNKVIPEMLRVNPGLYTCIRKKVVEQFDIE